MQTNYELALNEFRDASAHVRLCFAQVAEARELQIIADSKHKLASIGLAEAQARLDRADKALSAAREAPPQTQPVGLPLPRVTQAEIDQMAEPAWNGGGAPSTIDAQNAGIGIG